MERSAIKVRPGFRVIPAAAFPWSERPRASTVEFVVGRDPIDLPCPRPGDKASPEPYWPVAASQPPILPS